MKWGKVNLQRQSGFSLVELMVAGVISMILSMIVIQIMSSSNTRTPEQHAQTDRPRLRKLVDLPWPGWSAKFDGPVTPRIWMKSAFPHLPIFVLRISSPRQIMLIVLSRALIPLPTIASLCAAVFLPHLEMPGISRTAQALMYPQQ